MATRYYVNHNGSWTDPKNWAEVSGGSTGFSVPGIDDTAIIDSNSVGPGQGLSIGIGGGIAVGNLFATVPPGGLTMSGSTNSSNTFYGSLISTAPINWTATIERSFTFVGVGDHSFNHLNGGALMPVTINAPNGNYSLASNITVANFNLIAGNFNTNNYDIYCDWSGFWSRGGFFNIPDNDNIRSLNLGTSNITADRYVLIYRVGNGVTYSGTPNVLINFSNPQDTGIYAQNCTFNNLTITSHSTETGDSSTFRNRSVYIIGPINVNGLITINAVSVIDRRIMVRGLTFGTRAVINITGSQAPILSGVDFLDIEFTSSVSGITPISGDRLGNCGNTLGITYLPAKTVYWVLNSAGSWTSNGWSSTSGGVADLIHFPLAHDTVIIDDATPASTSLTINRASVVGTINASTRTIPFSLTYNADGRAMMCSDMILSSAITYSTGSAFIIPNLSLDGIAGISFNSTPIVYGNFSISNLAAVSIPNNTLFEGSFTANNIATLTLVSTVTFNNNFTALGATTIATTTANTTFRGNFTTGAGVTVTGTTGVFTFDGTGNQEITSNGVGLKGITINKITGTVRLQDSLNLFTDAAGRTLTLTAGVFNANDYNVTALNFSSTNSNIRTLNMGSGTWTMTGGNWDCATSANMVVNLGGVSGLIGTRYVNYFSDDPNWFNTATLHGDTNLLTEINNFTSNAEYYSWQWLGYFLAPTTGSYTFNTTSDDASYLWIGAVAETGFTTANALVNNGGLHAAQTRSGTITLTGGERYRLRIQFGELTGGDIMTVSFSGPGISTTTNGSGYYFSDSGTGNIDMASAGAKTFAGGNLIWSTLRQTGVGTLSITGNNTFTNITNTVQPSTISFANNSITYVRDFAVNGTDGNLITLQRASSGTFTLYYIGTSNFLPLSYLNVVNSVAHPYGTFYAENSTTSGTFTNWIATAAPSNTARTLYWVGGTGTWDISNTANWSETSGGTGGAAIPSNIDSVIFNSASGSANYTVTITGSVGCAGFNAAGPSTGTLTFAGTGTLNIFGNFTIAATGVARSYTGTTVFQSKTVNNTITTNGVAWRAMTFDRIGGAWTLGSALDITATALTVNNGTFSTGNFSVIADSFSSSNTNIRAINLGSSTLTLANATPITVSTITNLTFNTGTSNIVCTNANPTFNGSGLVYYDLTQNSTSTGTLTINNVNFFNNINLTAPVTNGYRTVSVTADQYLNGTIITTGTELRKRILIRSNTLNTRRYISLGRTANIQDTDFRDMIFSNYPVTGSRLGNLSRNTGIVFPEPKRYFWNLSGTQNWSANAWATTSGGQPSLDNFPLAQDTAVFDNSSAVGIVTLETAWFYSSIDASSRTTAMTIATATSSFEFYGDFYLSSSVTFTGSSGDLTFLHNERTQYIDVDTTGIKNVRINNNNGLLVLKRSLNLFSDTAFRTLTLETGNLNLNKNVLTIGTFSSTVANIRSINFDNGKIVVPTNNATIWNSNSSNLTLRGYANVELTYEGSVGTRTVAGGAAGLLDTDHFNFKILSGTDIVSTSGAVQTIDFVNLVDPTETTYTGFGGTLANTAVTIYGGWYLSSNMTLTAGTNTVTFASRAYRGIRTAGKTLDFPINFSGIGGTWVLHENLTLASTRTLSLTAGRLDMQNKTVSIGLLSSNNNNFREIDFGSIGVINITGENNTVYNVRGLNLSFKGNPIVNSTYSGATGTRTFTGGIYLHDILDINITAGTDIVAMSDFFLGINFTGFSGTLTNTTRYIIGDLIFSTGMSFTAGGNVTYLMSHPSSELNRDGNQTLRTNGRTINFPVQRTYFNYYGATATTTLLDNFTMDPGYGFTLLAGTFDSNDYSMTMGSFNSSNSNFRTLNMRNSFWTVSNGSWDCTTTTNMTITDNSLVSGLAGTRYVGYHGENPEWFITATRHGDTNLLTEINNFTNSADNYSWQWLGYFLAPTSGTYTFSVTSDDGGYLWLGPTAEAGFTTSNALVNNGGQHPAWTASGSRYLEGGYYYRLRLLYGEAGGGDIVTLSFSGPGIGTTTNGSGYYFTKDVATIRMESAAAKTFAGGNLTWPNVMQTGTGTLTITGTNTFNSLGNSVNLNTIAFPNTVTTFNNFQLRGTSGNLITLSGTSTLRYTGPDTINTDFLSIANSTVEPFGMWFSGANSTNVGSNVGWEFRAQPTATTRYWRGGTGTWDASTTTNWSASSGGGGGATAPTALDNVIFNTASHNDNYTVTITGNVVCKDLTIAGPSSGSVTFAGSGTLYVNGNINFAASGIIRSYTGTTVFTSNLINRTLTMNGMIWHAVSFNGAGSWSLSDAFNTVSTFQVLRGTLSTNNYNITADNFNSNTSNFRTINLGSSTVALSSATPWVFNTTTNLTFNRGESNIVLTATSPTFNGQNMTFFDVTQNSTTAGTLTINGVNTFNKLNFTAPNALGYRTVTLSADQILQVGIFTANTAANRRIFIQSSVFGTAISLTTGSGLLATGGTITGYSSGGQLFKVHTFSSSGSFDVSSSGDVNYLIIGGGGGGGGVIGGGGGAGGYLSGTTAVTPQSYPVTVGAGGLGGFAWNSASQLGAQGTNSSVFGFTAIGGGGGGAHGGSSPSGLNGTTGGSGGGAGNSVSLGALGTPGQGNQGGSGGPNNGGGGGGATSVGGNAVTSVSAGNGGSGQTNPITGTAVIYAGGGGGGLRTSPGGHGVAGTGGSGGGGNGGSTDFSKTATDGIDGTGGGGGGGGHNGNTSGNVRSAGNGGSGVVILSFPEGSVVSDTDFRDITINNGIITGVRLGNLGNNTNITFTAPKTVYWNLAGSQVWSANAWAATSGGTPSVDNFPLPQDTAVFDENGAADTVTLEATWFTSGIDTRARSTAMTIATGTANISLCGSLRLSSTTVFTGTTGTLTFTGGGTHNIRTNGVGLKAISMDSLNGIFTLEDSLNLNTSSTFRSLLFVRGTFNSGVYDVTAISFGSSYSNTRTLNMGSGTWTITGGNWDCTTSTNLTVTWDYPSRINMQHTAAKTFAGGSKSWPTLRQIGTGTLTITGTNTFYNIEATALPSTVVFPNVITTFSHFNLRGTAGNLLTMTRTGASGVFILAKTSGTVRLNHVSISNSVISGGATWYAGPDSTNGGNNTGWLFQLAPSRFWVGGSGSWGDANKWAASSGGAGGAGVPTSETDVYFDANSHTTSYSADLGINVTRVMRSLSLQGPATGTVTFTGLGYHEYAIHGSLFLGSGVSFTVGGMSNRWTNFYSTEPSNTFNRALPGGPGYSTMSFNGELGEYTMLEDLSTLDIFFTRGILRTNNFNLTTGLMSSNNSNVRALIAGTSTITTPTFDFGTGTNFIGSMHSSSLVISSVATSSTNFTAPNTVFKDVQLTSSSSDTTRNYFISGNMEIRGTLTASATNNARRIRLRSNTVGTQRTLTIDKQPTLSGVDFLDIAVISSTPITGTSLGNVGNNSGITFTTPKTVYWNLSGTQNWTSNGWASSSGGTPDSSNFPLAQDTVIFDNTGAAGTVQVNADLAVGTINTSSRTTTMTISGGGIFVQPIASNSSGVTFSLSGLFFGSVSFTNSPAATIGASTLTGSITMTDVPSCTIQAVVMTGSINVTNATTLSVTTPTVSGNLTANNVTTLSMTAPIITGNLIANNVTTLSMTTPNIAGSMSINTGNLATIGAATITGAFSSTSYNGLTLSGATIFNSSFTVSGTTAIETTTLSPVFRGDFTIDALCTFNGTTGNLVFSGAAPVTLTSNGVKLKSIEINNATGGITLGSNLTLETASTGRTMTLTAGTLDLGSYTLTAGVFTSSNSNVRSINATGNIVITNNAATVWNMGTITNATISGSPTVDFNYNGGTGTRTITLGAFTTNPFTVNISAGTDIITMTGSANNLNFTGFSGTLTNSARNVYGTLTLSSGMTLTAGTNATTFMGSSTATILDQGKIIDFPVTIDKQGGILELSAALDVAARTITLTNGTFDSKNYNVTAGGFASTNSNIRTLTLGSETWTITGTAGWNCSTSTNMTVNRGTATLNFTNAAEKPFNGGGLSWPTINLGGTGMLRIGNADNIIFNVTNTVTPANLTLPNNVITNFENFNLNGVSGALVTVSRSTSGTATIRNIGNTPIISSAFLAITAASVRPFNGWYASDSTFSSTTGWVSGTAPVTGVTRYWRGGTGTWNTSNTANWSETSGGVGGASIPTVLDDVVFDAGSGSANYTVTISGNVVCKNFSAAGPSTGTLTFASTGTLYVNGNFYIAPTGVARSYTGTTVFQTKSNAPKSFDLNNLTWSSFTIDDNNEWSLDKPLSLTTTLTLNAGRFNTNGYNLTIGSFVSNSTEFRTLDYRNSNWNITGSGTAWNISSSLGKMTLIHNLNSVIDMSSTSAKTFAGDSRSWPTLRQTGTGTLTIAGTNFFENIVNTVQPTTIAFPNAVTTVNGFNINGRPGNLVTLSSTSTISKATLGDVRADYLALSNTTVTGSANWYLGRNSVDNGNNVGWNIVGTRLGTGLYGIRYDGYFADNVYYFLTAREHGEKGLYTSINNAANFTTSIGINSWQWTGYFLAPTTGMYVFYTNSDDASYVWLGSTALSGYQTANALVNNGGIHGAQVRTGQISLTAGIYYPIRIQYGQNTITQAAVMTFGFYLPNNGTLILDGTGYLFGTSQPFPADKKSFITMI